MINLFKCNYFQFGAHFGGKPKHGDLQNIFALNRPIQKIIEVQSNCSSFRRERLIKDGSAYLCTRDMNKRFK